MARGNCAWSPVTAASLISIYAAAGRRGAKQEDQLASGPTVDQLLPVGIQRLQENKTWKVWKWPPADKEFIDAKEFM